MIFKPYERNDSKSAQRTKEADKVWKSEKGMITVEEYTVSRLTLDGNKIMTGN